MKPPAEWLCVLLICLVACLSGPHDADLVHAEILRHWSKISSVDGEMSYWFTISWLDEASKIKVTMDIKVGQREWVLFRDRAELCFHRGYVGQLVPCS